eukprot:2507219-Pleurochrysis_carterae.AAC.1
MADDLLQRAQYNFNQQLSPTLARALLLHQLQTDLGQYGKTLQSHHLLQTAEEQTCTTTLAEPALIQEERHLNIDELADLSN